MRKNIIFIVALSLVFVIVLSACKSSSSSAKTCKDDACFETAVRECSPATYTKVDSGNSYSYAVNGLQGNSCSIMIKVNEVSSNTPEEIAKLMRGKSMTCNIPKGTYNSGIIQLKSLDGCSGSLKDGIDSVAKQLLGGFAK